MFTSPAHTAPKSPAGLFTPESLAGLTEEREMNDATKMPLHDLLAIAAHKARAHMGEGRAHVAFQDLVQSAAQFSQAHYEGDENGMHNAMCAVEVAASDFCAENEEPAEYDWQAEESRVFQSARAL